MKFINNKILVAAVSIGFLLVGCSKSKPYDITIPPAEVHFVGKAKQVYSASDVTPAPFKVTIGTTDVSASARTATYRITSPSGAEIGVDYTISYNSTNMPAVTGSVTIGAGKALDSIFIQARSYSLGEKDTLVFTLEEPAMTAAGFLNTVMVIISGPSACDEAFPVLDDLLGDYTNTNEDLNGSPYGPYTTAIASATATSATTAIISVENIYDYGWNPINFELDWSDPLNRLVNTPDQTDLGDATTLSSTNTGLQVAVTQGIDGPGTYSYCNQTLTLRIKLGVNTPGGAVLGYYNIPYTVNMAR